MSEQELLDCMKDIPAHCISYRQVVDVLFDHTPDWRTRYLDLLIATTKLYLDYVFVKRYFPAFEAITLKRRKTTISDFNVDRERALRNKLTKYLDAPDQWINFRPTDLFSEVTGLISLQNYKDRLTLHLPEIYEETFHVEAFAASFLSNRNGAALARLSVGLEHLGRNHISFVLQALQWLSDEGSWVEHPEAELKIRVPRLDDLPGAPGLES